jgi:hypothetical protein
MQFSISLDIGNCILIRQGHVYCHLGLGIVLLTRQSTTPRPTLSAKLSLRFVCMWTMLKPKNDCIKQTDSKQQDFIKEDTQNLRLGSSS